MLDIIIIDYKLSYEKLKTYQVIEIVRPPPIV